MARKKRLIIPVFIPFEGCPNRCVYCDQAGITGGAASPGTEEVAATIELYLSTWKGPGPREVAFYGGTFTALPEPTQLEYLSAALGYVERGVIDSIRVSTRPDAVTPGICEFLKAHRVGTVELGVQSMDDRVLALSGRGHGSEDTRRAACAVKEAGLALGVQIMPGLPGDTVETAIRTTEEVIGLGPAFARVYPAVVLKDTPLERMYEEGSFVPWTLEETTGACALILDLFRGSGVPVIRLGLHHSEALEKQVVAGPYHPALKDLVERTRGAVRTH